MLKGGRTVTCCLRSIGIIVVDLLGLDGSLALLLRHFALLDWAALDLIVVVVSGLLGTLLAGGGWWGGGIVASI